MHNFKKKIVYQFQETYFFLLKHFVKSLTHCFRNITFLSFFFFFHFTIFPNKPQPLLTMIFHFAEMFCQKWSLYTKLLKSYIQIHDQNSINPALTNYIQDDTVIDHSFISVAKLAEINKKCLYKRTIVINVIYIVFWGGFQCEELLLNY